MEDEKNKLEKIIDDKDTIEGLDIPDLASVLKKIQKIYSFQKYLSYHFVRKRLYQSMVTSF